jgi:hypothetical protein
LSGTPGSTGAGPASRAGTLLASLWRRWKAFAHVAGTFQARVVLTLFYFVVVPPFALIVKIFVDPLALRAPADASSFWLPRGEDDPPSAGLRQF